MRKAKRFKPKLIEKWIANGRGEGTHAAYQPFHQVTRADPASRGTSSIVPGGTNSSAKHRLSQIERVFGALASMEQDIDDERWQFLLSDTPHLNELESYFEARTGEFFDGTVDICARLHIKHPVLRHEQEQMLWRMSTDLLLTLRRSNAPRKLFALSAKDKPLARLSKRARELLDVERTYWMDQGHEWLLITPDLYCPTYANCVLMAWDLIRREEPASEECLAAVVEIARSVHGANFSTLFKRIEQARRCDGTSAQRMFWQAVWGGMLPIDIKLSQWFSNPVRLISNEAFRQANPILSRRTAWKS